MPRLFYENDQPRSIDVQDTRMSFKVRDRERESLRYLEKVAKLIPSEIIAGYVTLIGFIPLVRTVEIQSWLYGAVFVICLVLTPIYMNLQSEKNKPKYMHLVLSSMAFIVWSYAVSGSAVIPTFHDPAVASILLILFSLISGTIPLKK
jgi:hypothetical protein